MTVPVKKREKSTDEKPEPTVALSPLTGFHVDDLIEMLGSFSAWARKRPTVVGRRLGLHSRKVAEVLIGTSDYAPSDTDRRFKDDAWHQTYYFKKLMQLYLAFVESLEELSEDLGMEDVDKVRADFLVRLIGESASPSNALLGNPAALRKARQTWGASLVAGAKNLLHDLRFNHGIPAQVKKDSFEVGVNLASTPGAVVFRNEMLELIQYTPVTKTVNRRPLLIVSAMINKYYALDLSEDRSFVKYCVENGLQTFIVSWANPSKEQAHWGINEYALAVGEAVDAVKSITKCKDINLFSLCSGAMVTSALAACRNSRGDNSIHSMTVGVCMLDMQRTDTEMGALLTPDIYKRVKKRSTKKGVLSGHELALSMLWLRPKDLIWGNIVNNYLMGNDPPVFDLLYWNNDWTTLPGKLHCDFLDIFHLGSLITPGALEIDGVPIDLSGLDCDKLFVGGVSDHITALESLLQKHKKLSVAVGSSFCQTVGTFRQ